MGRTLDHILKAEKPDVVAQATVKAEDTLLRIQLAEIRALMQKTQMDIAAALGVKQPTVAGMEKAGQDIKLSTLKRYIEAAGGKINLDIEFPDGKNRKFSL